MKSADSCKTTRVTISIPQEAGENLKQLARFNKQLLNELGILSMQIDDAKPVIVGAMQNKQCPDAQRKSFAGCSWKSDDLKSGCWRPVANIRSQVTPVLNQIEKHSRDLLMPVLYGDCLSPAYSANMYMPNGRVNICHNIAVIPEQKAASGFVVEKEQRQQCAANSRKLCRSKPQLLPLAMSQMSSFFGAGYHHPPELHRTEAVASVHKEPSSYSLPVSCNHPLNAEFEPPRAKVRPRRQRKKAFSNVKKLQQEGADKTCFVRAAAEPVKVCLSNELLASNSINVLPVARQFHAGSLTKPALPGMLTQALESAIVPNDSLSQAVVSECKFNCAVGSKLAAEFEISRLDLNSSDKTRLKFSCTAPTRDAALLVDSTGQSCNNHFAREDEEGMAVLSSSVSDGCLSSPNSLRSTACMRRDDAKFSCAIPEMHHNGSINSRAEPYAIASCGNAPPYIAPLSSADFHLNDKSGFLETVSSDVELLSSGYAVSESCATGMALLSCNESVANSLQQTSCVHRTYTSAAHTSFHGIDRDSTQCLAATCCIRKYDLMEEKSDSGKLPLNSQVSAEMKKLSRPMPVDDSRSATDAQLTDLDSFHQVDELNYGLNAGRSRESAADELDVGSIEKVAEMSLSKEDLSCVTSLMQLDSQLDSRDSDMLALQFSSDGLNYDLNARSVMEELKNLPLEKTEPLLEELQNLQCVLAADACDVQLPESSVNIQSDEGSVTAVNAADEDDDLKLPINSPSIEKFTESSFAEDFAALPLVTAMSLTPLLTSERSEDTMQRIIDTGISSDENERISAVSKSEESVDIALDSNLTDRNLIEKPSRNGLRGKRSNGTAPVCLDWSALSDDDMRVIKFNNRHSALDLHSRHFEELSICSRKASLSDDLRQLNALVMCEFDSLALKASSLLCVTKLTDVVAQSGLQQSRKVRIIKSTDISGNVRTKRKRTTGHFSMLEKHRMKRKTGRDAPMLTKGQRSQLLE